LRLLLRAVALLLPLLLRLSPLSLAADAVAVPAARLLSWMTQQPPQWQYHRWCRPVPSALVVTAAPLPLQHMTMPQRNSWIIGFHARTQRVAGFTEEGLSWNGSD